MHALLSGGDDFRRMQKVRRDVLQRFGYYSTESNSHLIRYLPWYRKPTDEIGQLPTRGTSPTCPTAA